MCRVLSPPDRAAAAPFRWSLHRACHTHLDSATLHLPTHCVASCTPSKQLQPFASVWAASCLGRTTSEQAIDMCLFIAPSFVGAMITAVCHTGAIRAGVAQAFGTHHVRDRRDQGTARHSAAAARVDRCPARTAKWRRASASLPTVPVPTLNRPSLDDMLGVAHRECDDKERLEALCGGGLWLQG